MKLQSLYRRAIVLDTYGAGRNRIDGATLAVF